MWLKIINTMGLYARMPKKHSNWKLGSPVTFNYFTRAENLSNTSGVHYFLKKRIIAETT